MEAISLALNAYFGVKVSVPAYVPSHRGAPERTRCQIATILGDSPESTWPVQAAIDAHSSKLTVNARAPLLNHPVRVRIFPAPHPTFVTYVPVTRPLGAMFWMV